jgi:hypothetical protein
VIGLSNVDKAIINALDLAADNHFVAILVITMVVVMAAGFQLLQLKKNHGSR